MGLREGCELERVPQGLIRCTVNEFLLKRIFTGLLLASGLVVFASIVSDVALERPRRGTSPVFQYRYGWSFFSAGVAFVLSEVAAVLSITSYLRFPTAEHMVRALVPGAERKLLTSRHSDYGVRTPSEHNKELLVPSFEESLEGPLLTKPDLCSTTETQCQSCKKEQERQLEGTTVPITLGTLTLRPQKTTVGSPLNDVTRRYATLGHHQGVAHAGLLGVHDGTGSWSSGSSPSSSTSCPRPPRKHLNRASQPPVQPVI